MWAFFGGNFNFCSFQEAREQAAEAAAMKKDPDAYRAKMEAMEAARMRMQEKYNQVNIWKYCYIIT